MNLSENHIPDKEVSAKSVFEKTEAKVTAIQILKDGLLKEHSTKTPAVLVCVSGEVVYEDEKNNKELLTSGDYYDIEPMVKHWVKGIKNSQLLLIK
jgi:quercetin dioxygenase-like cupin family protein